MSLHHRDVLRSAEWKQMKRERSELANDLLESVLVGDGAANSEDFSFSGSDESASTSSGNVLVNDNRPPLRKRVRRAAIR